MVVEFHVIATAARSGVPIDQTYWHAARLRDGKIVSLGFFRSEADAEGDVARPGGPATRRRT